MTTINKGNPYHGSSMVERGKLAGSTGMTDYFFFLCPQCSDSQILEIPEYEVRHQGPMNRAGQKGLKVKEEFILAFHVHCPECGFDDFVKLGNGHRANKLKNNPIRAVATP